MDADEETLIGVDVGGYVVECELGRGGMGVVYAATHPMIGKRAAIKVLASSLSNNPSTVERFIQEARAVNQIGHPNIVDIFAFGTLPDGRSYLVMDLLAGETLRKRIKREPIPPAEAGQIIDEIAAGLIAAHAKGFIHRDLKPDNVFLVANPNRYELKILDFGLAKLLPTSGLSSERAYRTATGALLGTPDYMPPEQLRGAGVDHRADIDSLGIMAFEMIARLRPLRFGEGFDLKGKTFRGALLEIPGVPVELAELIETMVARDPEHRPSLTAVRAVVKRLRPTLGAAALSNVRPVSSALSLEHFDASALGAKPDVLPAEESPSATSAMTLVRMPGHDDSSTAHDVAAHDTAAQPAPEPSAAAGLRMPAAPGMSTKLGVAPARIQLDRPHPVAAARRPKESKRWLLLGFALLVASAIALVIVLLT